MAIDGKLLSGVTVLLAVVEGGTIARAAEAVLGLSPSGCMSRALGTARAACGRSPAGANHAFALFNG